MISHFEYPFFGITKNVNLKNKPFRPERNIMNPSAAPFIDEKYKSLEKSYDTLKNAYQTLSEKYVSVKLDLKRSIEMLNDQGKV